MLYAVPVEATIANGKLVALDMAAAEKMPGVRAIFHRANIGKIFRSTPAPGFDRVCLERRPPFEDDVIRYYGQYIALAVADTFEAAKAAADAVRATYSKENPMLSLASKRGTILTSSLQVMDQCRDSKATAGMPQQHSTLRLLSSTKPTLRLPKRTIRSSCTPPLRCGMESG
jgi:Aerobic-type carbon monoxide dehydrogenase, large subunit CoxL/CutL homologs